MPRTAKPKRGRPPIAGALRREPFAVRLHAWLIEWLDTREESRAELIEEALKEKHRLREPSKSSI